MRSIIRFAKRNAVFVTALFAMLITMFFVPVDKELPAQDIINVVNHGDMQAIFYDKSYEKILGVLVSANMAGYALGAPTVNLCFDIMGSYKPILITCSVIMLGITVTMQLIINKANKIKEDVAKEMLSEAAS